MAWWAVLTLERMAVHWATDEEVFVFLKFSYCIQFYRNPIRHTRQDVYGSNCLDI